MKDLHKSCLVKFTNSYAVARKIKASIRSDDGAIISAITKDGGVLFNVTGNKDSSWSCYISNAYLDVFSMFIMDDVLENDWSIRRIGHISRDFRENQHKPIQFDISV